MIMDLNSDSAYSHLTKSLTCPSCMSGRGLLRGVGAELDLVADSELAD